MSNPSVTVETEYAHRAWADWVGMVASIGCAIHCAAMPLVIAYLPMFGLGWLADEGFHQWMALFCFGMAIFAFLPGWKKHQSLIPVIVGGMGVLLLTTAAFGLEECSCTSCEVVATDLVEQQGCSDASCQLCKNEPQAISQSITKTKVVEAESGSWFIPFVTPLGGALLVVGHVVNHRKSCHCQGDSCCLTTVEMESAE